MGVRCGWTTTVSQRALDERERVSPTIFQSKYKNYVIVFEPKDKIFMPGRRVNKIPGIRAEFGGPQQLFDSDTAARTFRWSEEEKQNLEKYLVSMPEFGKELYLKPGQVVPDYLEDSLKQASEWG